MPPDITSPRSTDEFRLVEEVRAHAPAYIRFRDGTTFKAVGLTPTPSPMYIGRDESCPIRVEADERVSRRHARLIFGAGCWSIEDAGSRNGTFVCERPVSSEVVLDHEDEITVGDTRISFHQPKGTDLRRTLVAETQNQRLRPSETQRKVLIELSRPWFEHGDEVPVAPTNQAIAQRLGYQVSTIRDAISDLYRQGGLERGRVDQRVELVRLAIRERTVTPDSFR
jgi:hypothetical protein